MEVVVQREQEWQHLDKTEGGGCRAGSADMATGHWRTETVGRTQTRERRNRMQRRRLAAQIEFTQHFVERRSSFSFLR